MSSIDEIKGIRHPYPDLSYLERLFWSNIINKHPEFEHKIISCDIRADLFLQTWPNTAGGFSEPGMFSGQMFVSEYTTVMQADITIKEDEKPKKSIYYGVFFGNEPAYLVENPTDIFFEDLKYRKIKSKYEASKAY